MHLNLDLFVSFHFDWKHDNRKRFVVDIWSIAGKENERIIIIEGKWSPSLFLSLPKYSSNEAMGKGGKKGELWLSIVGEGIEDRRKTK